MKFTAFVSAIAFASAARAVLERTDSVQEDAYVPGPARDYELCNLKLGDLAWRKCRMRGERMVKNTTYDAEELVPQQSCEYVCVKTELRRPNKWKFWQKKRQYCIDTALECKTEYVVQTVSKHMSCKANCCGGIEAERGDPYFDCGCIHKDESCSDLSYCCGFSNVTNAHVCGCADNGRDLRSIIGAQESDCCSGHWNTEKVCKPRECKKAGENIGDGHCCRVTGDDNDWVPGQHDSGDVCSCHHAGAVPFLGDEKSKENCCSGELNEDGSCACIDSPEDEMPATAVDTDCCSGEVVDRNGKRFCKAETCTKQGEEIDLDGGDHCCSGWNKEVDGNQHICSCVPGGEAVPEGQDGSVCCTRKAREGLCTFIRAGQYLPVLMGATEASCSSGRVDSTGHCLHLRAGEKISSPNLISKSECGSLRTEDDNVTCACSEVGQQLARGMDEADCCSGTGRASTCACAPPGAPIVDGRHCCAKYSLNGFCGCFSIGMGPHPQYGCCGGMVNQSSHDCACLPKGYLAPSNMAPSFAGRTGCCNGAHENGVCP